MFQTEIVIFIEGEEMIMKRNDQLSACEKLINRRSNFPILIIKYRI